MTLYLCVRGQAGVETGGSQEVEGDDCLGQQLVLELQFKVWIASAQDSHKVVLPGVDGSFGNVFLVGVDEIQLVIGSLDVKEGDKCTGCLVVEECEAGSQTAGGYDIASALVRHQDLVSGPRRHGFNMHIFAVEVVQHEHVVVSRGGSMRETAGLICEDFARCRETLYKDRVGASAGGWRCGQLYGVVVCGWQE